MYESFSPSDFHLMRVFMAVVEAQGFSAAQANLNVNQSTISTQIAQLEKKLGYRLCNRGRSGFSLTEKGQYFYQLCNSLMDSIDTFQKKSSALVGQLVGQCRIGIIGHSNFRNHYFLSKAIELYRDRTEQVELVFTILAPDSLEEALLNKTIDIGIGYCWHTVPQLVYHRLYFERQIAYCGKSHPLFSHPTRVSLQTAQEHYWAWRTYPTPSLPFPTANLKVNAYADNMESMAVLILSGKHLGFLPRHFADPFVEQQELKPLNEGFFAYDAPIDIIYRPASIQQEVIKLLIDDLLAVQAEPNATYITPFDGNNVE